MNTWYTCIYIYIYSYVITHRYTAYNVWPKALICLAFLPVIHFKKMFISHLCFLFVNYLFIYLTHFTTETIIVILQQFVFYILISENVSKIVLFHPICFLFRIFDKLKFVLFFHFIWHFLCIFHFYA